LKIKALTNFAGIDFSFVKGQVQEVEDKLGRELIKAGLVEAVKEKEIETATVEPSEEKAVVLKNRRSVKRSDVGV